MDEETRQKMTAIEQKIDAIYRTTEKTRKYFIWTLIVTLALVVLPAVGLLFAVPTFMAAYGSLGDITNIR